MKRPRFKELSILIGCFEKNAMIWQKYGISYWKHMINKMMLECKLEN